MFTLPTNGQNKAKVKLKNRSTSRSPQVSFRIFVLMIILPIRVLEFKQYASEEVLNPDSAIPQPTNGTYNMQFDIYDSALDGTQIGSTLREPGGFGQ